MKTLSDYNRTLMKASAPRVNRIKRLRRGGLSWGAIGKMLGISRQRAQQLATKDVK